MGQSCIDQVSKVIVSLGSIKASKNGYFTVKLTVRGGGALTVSKCENLDPFFSLKLTLLYSKHNLSHCKRSQKCIFHVLNASGIPLSDHFVTEQQYGRIGDSSSWMK